MNAVKFAYMDYRRRKRMQRNDYRSVLKISGLVIFILIIAWMIHDLIKFWNQ